MLSPEERELLARFEPRRFCALTQAEAAELGSETLRDWDFGIDGGWVVDVRDLVELRRDAMRYRTLRLRAECVGMLLAGAGVVVALVTVLSLVFG